MAGSSRVLLGLALCGALASTGSIGAAEQGQDAESKRVLVKIGSAYLGVDLDEVVKEDVARLKLPEERGALVRSVEDGSPAQKAGLKADDVIVRFQGENVHTARQLARLVREQPSGRSVSIEALRGGASQRLQATLDERAGGRGWSFDWPDFTWKGFDHDLAIRVPPVPPAAPRAPLAPSFSFSFGGPRKLGIEYQEIGDQLARFFKLSEDRGVLVSRVEDDSPAAKAGIKAGDVLLKVSGRSVKDGEDLRDELRRADPGSEIAVTVQRDGKPQELKVKLAGSSEPRRRRGLPT
jgi:S1-C subfamily serine protease